MNPILAQSVVVYRSKFEQAQDEFLYDVLTSEAGAWLALGLLGLLVSIFFVSMVNSWRRNRNRYRR